MVARLDVEVLAEQIEERPVRRHLARRARVDLEDPTLAQVLGGAELPEEPRLAEPRVASHEDELSAPVLGRPPPRGQERDLLLASDHPRLPRDRVEPALLVPEHRPRLRSAIA